MIFRPREPHNYCGGIESITAAHSLSTARTRHTRLLGEYECEMERRTEVVRQRMAMYQRTIHLFTPTDEQLAQTELDEVDA